MEILDAVVTVGLTSLAFFVGFCARGLFSEARGDEWPVSEHASRPYEPPRPNEHL
jgi:hypothetical protein